MRRHLRRAVDLWGEGLFDGSVKASRTAFAVLGSFWTSSRVISQNYPHVNLDLYQGVVIVESKEAQTSEIS